MTAAALMPTAPERTTAAARSGASGSHPASRDGGNKDRAYGDGGNKDRAYGDGANRDKVNGDGGNKDRAYGDGANSCPDDCHYCSGPETD